MSLPGVALGKALTALSHMSSSLNGDNNPHTAAAPRGHREEPVGRASDRAWRGAGALLKEREGEPLRHVSASPIAA